MRFPRRTITFALTILLLHVALSYALDAAGLVESLLSPSGAQLLWILPLAIFFYALRLTAFFVVPGLLVGSAMLWVIDKARDRHR